MTMLFYLLSFVVVLSIVVIVHEGGHFWMARLCGIQVVAFSVGFGKKLWSHTDKKGTEWKLCAIPLGGYVQMLGDEDAASMKKSDAGLSEEEKKHTFMAQPLWKRALVIFAGPFMNYFFAVVLLTVIFATVGYIRIPPVVDKVIPGSIAAEAGIEPNDEILTVNGKKVQDFTALKRMIMVSNYGQTLSLAVKRNDEVLTFSVLPRPLEGKSETPMLGVMAKPNADLTYERYNPIVGFGVSVEMVYEMTVDTLIYLKQVIMGQRSADDMRGPVGIAEASGDAAKAGFFALILFLIQVSVGIGFVNLLPVPLLDGGHLAMYAYEGIVRKPLNEAVQNALLKVGLVLLLGLFAFTMFKDVPRVIERNCDVPVVGYLCELIES